MTSHHDQRSHEQILPFEMGNLPPYYKRKAEIELNESPEIIEKGIRLMREKAKNDKNFKGQPYDDDGLLQFLRAKKHNVDKAFSRFRAFVILRKNYTDMFTDIRFNRILHTTRDNIITFLPYRCPEGCAIIHVRIGNWEPETFPLHEVKRALVVLLAQSLRDPMSQVNGFKVIFNTQCNPLKYIRYCTPSNLYLMYHAPQECSPARFKEIHIINMAAAFRATWIFVKQFMSKKMKQRVVFHSSPEKLLDNFPASVLPQEYGGDLKPYDLTEWLRKVTMPGKLTTIVIEPPTTHALRR